MNNWEKFKIVNGGLATLAIPAVIAFVGNQFSLSMKEKEVQEKYVELAIRILSETPHKDKSATREWAVDVVNKYSGVEMSLETEDHLVKSAALPTLDSEKF